MVREKGAAHGSVGQKLYASDKSIVRNLVVVAILAPLLLVFGIVLIVLGQPGGITVTVIVSILIIVTGGAAYVGKAKLSQARRNSRARRAQP